MKSHKITISSYFSQLKSTLFVEFGASPPRHGWSPVAPWASLGGPPKRLSDGSKWCWFDDDDGISCWFFMVVMGFYGDFRVILWWFQGDFMVISCDFIVISWWFHGDLMMILGFRWDSVRIYWYSIGFTYVIYRDFRGFGCDLLGFDGIDGNPLIFLNQCLWTGFDIASVPQIP